MPPRAGIIASVVLATGCASVTTLDGERLGMASPEFRAYVESVFRAQNRVATELAFALEADERDAREHAELEAAEQALIGACSGLNEIAAGRRDGRELGRLRAAKAARRAPHCERATRAAGAALASVRQEPADAD